MPDLPVLCDLEGPLEVCMDTGEMTRCSTDVLPVRLLSRDGQLTCHHRPHSANAPRRNLSRAYLEHSAQAAPCISRDLRGEPDDLRAMRLTARSLLGCETLDDGCLTRAVGSDHFLHLVDLEACALCDLDVLETADDATCYPELKLYSIFSALGVENGAGLSMVAERSECVTCVSGQVRQSTKAHVGVVRCCCPPP